jgi:transposase-like protein
MRGVAMSKYAIQFQKGLSIFEFNSLFSTREQCEEKVFKLKWGDHFTCPKCEHHHFTSFQREKRTIYQCRSCKGQTSLLVGTIFQRTHLPLTFWFTAIYLIGTAKTSISSLDLHRKLGINHKSAHLLLQTE